MHMNEKMNPHSQQKVAGHFSKCNPHFALSVAIKEICNLHEVAHTCAKHDDVAPHHWPLNAKSQMMWHKVKSNLTLPLPLKSSQT